MPGKIAVACPFQEFRGLTPYVFRMMQALWYACAKEKRPSPKFIPCKDGEVSYARAVVFALAWQQCRDAGDVVLSTDSDMAIPPEAILTAAELATEGRVIVLPYRKRQREQREWCFCLPWDKDGKPVLRMHVRHARGRTVRTFDVTRAGLGGQAVHPASIARVAEYLKEDPFYFDLNGIAGFAHPLFDPYYEVQEGRRHRFDDSYGWCARAIAAGLRLEALLDADVDKLAHDGMANGSELDEEFSKLDGYIPAQGDAP